MVREWSVVRELKAEVVGRGIDSDIVMRSGRSSSMTSGSGNGDNGEKRE